MSKINDILLLRDDIENLKNETNKIIERIEFNNTRLPNISKLKFNMQLKRIRSQKKCYKCENIGEYIIVSHDINKIYCWSCII